MNLELTETQKLLQTTVVGYLERELPLDRVRALEREQCADELLWKAVCEQGWLALAVTERFGGGEGTLLDLGLLVEAFARRAAIVPVLESAVVLRLLERHAAPDVARVHIEAVLSGQEIIVPALYEEREIAEHQPARVDAAGRLYARKDFVDFAADATHHLVAAANEAGEPVWVLVDRNDPGVTLEPLLSIGRTPVARVAYEAVPTSPIAAGGDSLRDLERLARAFAAVQCAASMAQSLDMAVDYAKVREQFGKAIGSFQAVRHHCSNMATRVSSSRQLAFEALSALEYGSATDSLVACAKASASRAAPEVTMLAHQIFGGNGVIEENDLYFFTLRAKERSLAWGSLDECLAIMADAVHARGDWL